MATDTISINNVAAGKQRDGLQFVMSVNLLHARLPLDIKKERYYGSSSNVDLSRMPENTLRRKSSRQYGSGHMAAWSGRPAGSRLNSANTGIMKLFQPMLLDVQANANRCQLGYSIPSLKTIKEGLAGMLPLRKSLFSGIYQLV